MDNTIVLEGRYDKDQRCWIAEGINIPQEALISHARLFPGRRPAGPAKLVGNTLTLNLTNGYWVYRIIPDPRVETAVIYIAKLVQGEPLYTTQGDNR